jgi:hypothetical protein
LRCRISLKARSGVSGERLEDVDQSGLAQAVAHVFLQLFDRRALGMGARKSRDVGNVEAGCRIALDDGLK